MTAAPFYSVLADGPERAEALWIRAADDVRLRAVLWPGGTEGTVLFFSGRTEYAEKYGPAARVLASFGYVSMMIDWRGQGLSDRAAYDRLIGHVDDFSEYQRDVAAMIALARGMGLPEPYHMLAHSMGGTIGLRALIEGLPVRSACFSAPMWGLRVQGALRVTALTLCTLAKLAGLTDFFVPGTGKRSYVLQTDFEDNLLTRDPDIFAWMKWQLTAKPELGLAGPSLGWLSAAFRETDALAALPSPDIPALAVVGSAERVVDPAAIEWRMSHWPAGALRIVPGAEHEVMVERPQVRRAFFESAAELFAAHGHR